MKILLKLLSVAVGLSVSIGEAKTILISDIDDTLKNSHVLDKADALLFAFATDNLTLGMSDLYVRFKSDNPQAKFFYVTNAPKSIMEGSHANFLLWNDFPRGALRLRDSIFQNNFKLTEIRKILRTERPDTVVFVGDNGEQDVFVYDQLKSENPQLRIFTYIHLPYSANYAYENAGQFLKPGQVGFATALDLSLQFRQQGLISNLNTVEFINAFVADYAREDEASSWGPHALPMWTDCRDFKWAVNDADLMNDGGYVNAKNRILQRCSKDPFATRL